MQGESPSLSQFAEKQTKTKAEQYQNRDFDRYAFNAIFLLAPHSSVFQIIPWHMIFNTWYYIVTCTMLCVSFSSKLKAINVFPKYFLKSKARDQSIQARKKLFWLVKVFDQNRKHVEAWNQRTGTVIDYFFLYPPILSGPPILMHASRRASGNGCHWSIAGTVVH